MLLKACGVVAFFLAVGTVTVQAGSEEAKATILLASEKTTFKDQLISRIAEMLAADTSVIIKRVDHTNGGLDSLNAADFSVVFLTNSGVNSAVRPWIVSWINANKDFATRIIVHTTQKSSWKVVLPVDAVTSASARDKVDQLAASYVALINKKSNAGGASAGEQPVDK